MQCVIAQARATSRVETSISKLNALDGLVAAKWLREPPRLGSVAPCFRHHAGVPQLLGGPTDVVLPGVGEIARSFQLIPMLSPNLAADLHNTTSTTETLQRVDNPRLKVMFRSHTSSFA